MTHSKNAYQFYASSTESCVSKAITLIHCNTHTHIYIFIYKYCLATQHVQNIHIKIPFRPFQANWHSEKFPKIFWLGFEMLRFHIYTCTWQHSIAVRFMLSHISIDLYKSTVAERYRFMHNKFCNCLFIPFNRFLWA